jgi:hypothetical protein
LVFKWNVLKQKKPAGEGKVLRDLVGAWGLEPQTSAVSRPSLGHVGQRAIVAHELNINQRGLSSHSTLHGLNKAVSVVCQKSAKLSLPDYPIQDCPLRRERASPRNATLKIEMMFVMTIATHPAEIIPGTI